MEFIKDILTVIFSIFNAMSFYLLLGFLFAGILHVWVPQHLFVNYLSKNNWVSVLYATLFGIPLPLCSCGVIPTAMALYKEGACKGAVVSFLIATPQTGIDSIIATYSLLGLPFAVIRPVAALVTSLFAGLTTTLFTAKETSSVVLRNNTGRPAQTLSLTQKLKQVFQYGYVDMMKDIGKMLFSGLVIAGFITYFVPDDFFMIFGNNTFLTMILVLLVAIPMYVCATGSIPIAIALMMKGMSPGTALVLLMAGPAANIASMWVIGKVLGKKTFVLYLTTLIIGAISMGLFIDHCLPASWFEVTNFTITAPHSGPFYYFKVVCSGILLILFANALLCKQTKPKEKRTKNTQASTICSFKIGGMRCNHCKNTAEKAIRKIPSVMEVTIDLSNNTAHVKGNPTDEAIKSAVEEIGFKFKGRI